MARMTVKQRQAEALKKAVTKREKRKAKQQPRINKDFKNQSIASVRG